MGEDRRGGMSPFSTLRRGQSKVSSEDEEDEEERERESQLKKVRLKVSDDDEGEGTMMIYYGFHSNHSLWPQHPYPLPLSQSIPLPRKVSTGHSFWVS